MAENIREGFWRSRTEPDLPMPVADETWDDHTVFGNLLFIVEAKLEVQHMVTYRGWSTCRCCDKPNGSQEFRYGGYQWPSGYRHYIEVHGIKPTDGFIQMIGKAALSLCADPAEFVVEQGLSTEINSVSFVYRNACIAALEIDTKVKQVKIGGTGSSDEVPMVFLDLNDGDDGDDTGIAFPQFKGWSVFAAQRKKYGARVVLINNDPQEEDDAVA